MSTAGRRTKAAPTDPGPDIDEGALSRASAALPALAEQAGQAMAAVGYDQPYDRRRIIQETRFFMGQAAEAMLEAGRRLIVLKEHEPHGEFESIVRDQLGIPERTAQVMMRAALKYLLNPALSAKAQTLALLGKSKLLELIAEPDDDLAALADGGTVAGHSLDAIDAMSTRELRAALRTAKEDAEGDKALLRDKNSKLDKLKAAQRLISRQTPDETLAQLTKEALEIMRDAQGCITGSLRNAIVAVQNQGEERGSNDRFLAGLVGELQHALNVLREDFSLPDVSSAADRELAGDVAQWGAKK